MRRRFKEPAQGVDSFKSSTSPAASKKIPHRVQAARDRRLSSAFRGAGARAIQHIIFYRLHISIHA